MFNSLKDFQSSAMLLEQTFDAGVKLRGFLASFFAVNPCEAKSRYLSLQSGLSTNGIRESQDCLATNQSYEAVSQELFIWN